MGAASAYAPVDAKRFGELQALFSSSATRLVLVLCFPDCATMCKFLTELAWGAEARCASGPTYMMYLNGE